MADVLLGERLNTGRRTFDKLTELRNLADGAETATAAETGVAFEIRKHIALLCVVDVTASVSNDNDETYVFTVEVSDLVGGTYTPIATLTVTRGVTGKYTIPLSGELAQKLDDDCDFIRIKATLGGTTPSITYGAYLATP